jgi:ribosomal-protein-alanine N-acetyltransferase
MMLFLHRNVHQRQIEGSGLVLRAPVFDDFAAWQALRAESAAFLIPWEPRWPVDDLTRSGFKRRFFAPSRRRMADSAVAALIHECAGRCSDSKA